MTRRPTTRSLTGRKQVDVGDIFADEWIQEHICFLGEADSSTTTVGRNFTVLNEFHSKSVDDVNMTRGAKKVVLGLLNWVAPSQSSAQLTRHQIELMGLLDHGDMGSTTGAAFIISYVLL